MCGILGVISKEYFNAKDILNKLKLLEYRGYDSAGISCLDNNNFFIKKEIGYIDNLLQNIENISSKNIICHTRWATTGKINKKNTHPHNSEKVTIVHNGIIDNYEELVAKFNLQDKLTSECDSEIISQLINLKCINNVSIENIINCFDLLKGSYAVLIQIKGQENHLFGAKQKSPLYVGVMKNGYIVSSDLITMNENVNFYYELADNEFFDIDINSNIKFYNMFKIEIKKQKKFISSFDTQCSTLNGFESFLEKEINEIPFALKNTYLQYKNNKYNLPCLNNFKEIHLVACGTAFHSAIVGKYVIENNLHIPCYAHIASEFLYENLCYNSKSLFIFISQSGETFDTLESVKKVKELNFTTFGITNTTYSQLSKLCDYILPIYAGKEISVASTKVYNCTILAFYYICDIKLNISLKQLHSLINNKKINALAKIVNNFQQLIFIGKCEDYVCAMEGALKFKELTYKNAIAYPCGELKHGSLALIDESCVTIAVLTNFKYLSAIKSALYEIKCRNGKTILITNLNITEKFADYIIKIKDFKNMPLNLYSIIPLQLLALNECKLLKRNPDKPRNLAKSVTVQ